MAGYFGWWDYESTPPTMVNRITGQRLAYQQTVGSGLLYDRVPVFLYSDASIEFPIVVRTSWQGRLTGSLHSTWEIDYDLSTESWRKTAASTDPHPPYDIWTRIDDCVVDALSCWPEEDSRISGHVLKSRGGWFCGQWLPGLKREYSGMARIEAKRQELVGSNADPVRTFPGWAEPISVPGWHFVDTEVASLKIELDHMDASRGFSYLPAGTRLSGFERVPHLLRHDGAAVYFPCEISTRFHRGEDCYLHALFRYADEHVVLALQESEEGTAVFLPSLCGVRSAEEAAAYRPFQPPPYELHLRPALLPHWRRAVRVLSEVRFLWQGTERRMQVAPDVWERDQRAYGSHARGPAPALRFRPLRSFTLHGGFLAGMPAQHRGVRTTPWE